LFSWAGDFIPNCGQLILFKQDGAEPAAYKHLSEQALNRPREIPFALTRLLYVDKQ